MSASWYDVLGVAPDAGSEEIRAAWKASISDLDPTDRRFALYNEAAGVLLDPDRRAAYDAGSVAAAPGAPAAAVDEPAAAEPAVDEPAADEPAPDGPAPDQTTAVGAAPAAGDRSGRLGRLARRVPRAAALPVRALVALAVLVALVLGAATWLQLTTVDSEAVEASLSDAREAAEAGLPKVFTYDYRFPDRDRDQAARVLTGDLRTDYEDLWDDAIGPNLERTKGTATSEVVGSGAVRTSGEGDRAEILVVLNTVTSNANQEQQVTLGLTVTMVEREGDWLIEKIDGWDPEVAGEGAEDPTEDPTGDPTEGPEKDTQDDPSEDAETP
ncbi:J domain-containing protein [Nocardioides donggukensis]|uniref:J domain-containing protein n=1 Tax=Nocardioides donggukensis TaxID=2774019 RepID=A0A927PZS7_9ACTN|nr:DnaJ domain-containing protein [Nocardioides donggukensis]MBD8870733.1 hypothetical protein [Nocardioides donggukensis]